jgi:hypothetical protein
VVGEPVIEAARRALAEYDVLDPESPRPAFSWAQLAMQANLLHEAGTILDEALRTAAGR